MKYQLQLLIFILLCLAGRLDASPLYDYGLYLKSHAVPAPERSTLYLDDNQPFSVKNDLTISFQIYIRANEADYGSILHLMHMLIPLYNFLHLNIKNQLTYFLLYLL